jgi:hypothetical protein
MSLSKEVVEMALRVYARTGRRTGVSMGPLWGLALFLVLGIVAAGAIVFVLVAVVLGVGVEVARYGVRQHRVHHALARAERLCLDPSCPLPYPHEPEEH